MPPVNDIKHTLDVRFRVQCGMERAVPDGSRELTMSKDIYEEGMKLVRMFACRMASRNSTYQHIF
jgi:hypothetical protein